MLREPTHSSLKTWMYLGCLSWTTFAACASAQTVLIGRVTHPFSAADGSSIDLQFQEISAHKESVVITAKSLEPTIDLRNAEVFNRTLFTRDDQVLQQLNAGISAGQHEGGGKSLEIRRFGFNLDHGGVNGGLKVLVDGVQQNQGSQGHGQGYLGSLKALSPELIEGVTIINGPFSPEYGDFSGLGVVHIRQRKQYTPTLRTKARTRMDRLEARAGIAGTTSTRTTPRRWIRATAEESSLAPCRATIPGLSEMAVP